jgi:hypothetical protein
MRWNRKARGELGQALVEMALVLPVLLLLLLGILEFGRAWYTKQVITDAARENNDIDQADVKAAVATALSRAGIPGAATTIAFDENVPPAGHWRDYGTMQTVYVGVDYRFGFFGPLLEAVTGSDHVTIATLITMRNE